MALGLKASVGHEAKLKEASDSDIIAASTSLTVRLSAAHEEASTIIGALNDIAPGPAGFRRYEELMKQAVEFAFRGYLDNGHIQERNWSGTQVRDLVFDNTGETKFFNQIRNHNGAVSVVFECKNKLELEPADFHQIEVRLGSPAGHFGFICYRAQRSEPDKREVDFVREINARDRKRVVLLLTDFKLLQLIERRTKGKLDKFLYSWYSTYLRNYFT
jgi:hypothetical protein